jgi:hypothetical protein
MTSKGFPYLLHVMFRKIYALLWQTMEEVQFGLNHALFHFDHSYFIHHTSSSTAVHMHKCSLVQGWSPSSLITLHAYYFLAPSKTLNPKHINCSSFISLIVYDLINGANTYDNDICTLHLQHRELPDMWIFYNIHDTRPHHSNFHLRPYIYLHII